MDSFRSCNRLSSRLDPDFKIVQCYSMFVFMSSFHVIYYGCCCGRAVTPRGWWWEPKFFSKIPCWYFLPFSTKQVFQRHGALTRLLLSKSYQGYYYLLISRQVLFATFVAVHVSHSVHLCLMSLSLCPRVSSVFSRVSTPRSRSVHRWVVSSLSLVLHLLH